MTIPLSEGRHITVDRHSGKVWLTSYNGQGVVNPLTAKEAKRLSRELWAAAVEAG